MRLIDYHNENENDKEKSNTLIPEIPLALKVVYIFKVFGAQSCLLVA